MLGPPAPLARIERAVWIHFVLESRQEACACSRRCLMRIALSVQCVGGKPAAQASLGGAHIVDWPRRRATLVTHLRESSLELPGPGQPLTAPGPFTATLVVRQFTSLQDESLY
jgi:hypothetical protein